MNIFSYSHLKKLDITSFSNLINVIYKSNILYLDLKDIPIFLNSSALYSYYTITTFDLLNTLDLEVDIFYDYNITLPNPIISFLSNYKRSSAKLNVSMVLHGFNSLGLYRILPINEQSKYILDSEEPECEMLYSTSSYGICDDFIQFIAVGIDDFYIPYAQSKISILSESSIPLSPILYTASSEYINQANISRPFSSFPWWLQLHLHSLSHDFTYPSLSKNEITSIFFYIWAYSYKYKLSGYIRFCEDLYNTWFNPFYTDLPNNIFYYRHLNYNFLKYLEHKLHIQDLPLLTIIKLHSLLESPSFDYTVFLDKYTSLPDSWKKSFLAGLIRSSTTSLFSSFSFYSKIIPFLITSISDVSSINTSWIMPVDFFQITRISTTVKCLPFNPLPINEFFITSIAINTPFAIPHLFTDDLHLLDFLVFAQIRPTILPMKLNYYFNKLLI